MGGAFSLIGGGRIGRRQASASTGRLRKPNLASRRKRPDRLVIGPRPNRGNPDATAGQRRTAMGWHGAIRSVIFRCKFFTALTLVSTQDYSATLILPHLSFRRAISPCSFQPYLR